MAATDVVSVYLADLIAKVKRVSAIKAKTVALYDQYELLDYTQKVLPPCCGVVYVGMTTVQPDSHRRGRAVELICDVVVIGGDVCGENSPELPRVTTILDNIRDTVKGTVGQYEKVWRFVSEYPFMMKNENNQGLLGYSQRWSAIVEDEA
jgi:hypothetical protein